MAAHFHHAETSATTALIHRVLAIALSVALVTPASFALAASPQIADFSTPGWNTEYFINGKQPFIVSTLSLDVKAPSKVLVQFSSEITSEHAENCPCYIRAMVSMDGGKARPINRINLGSPAIHDTNKYDNDRETLSGTTVFDAAPGKHTYELTFQQVESNGTKVEIYYPNFSAVAFPNE
ncbi:hypothetical protein [Paraburkholderia phosphatilytica]|uniref:hypothetical protein n=1 Tax=Paraburkholderia phosphatilytica TaxID=2282883 RepID=UPI000E527FAA|nr:hypothetical protein [Paraburkholderia phosphatilytica]